MNLNDYLALSQQAPSNFAKELGLAPSVITRFLKGDRGMSMKTAMKIYRGTRGAVRPEDLAPSNGDG